MSTSELAKRVPAHPSQHQPLNARSAMLAAKPNSTLNLSTADQLEAQKQAEARLLIWTQAKCTTQ